MSAWEAFLLWLYGAGVAQGLFLIIALMGFKAKNETARNFLIAIVVVATLMLAGWKSHRVFLDANRERQRPKTTKW